MATVCSAGTRPTPQAVLPAHCSARRAETSEVVLPAGCPPDAPIPADEPVAVAHW
jgi:hypothetical protein